MKTNTKTYNKSKSSKKTKTRAYNKKSKSMSKVNKTQKKMYKGGSNFFEPTFVNVPLKSMIPFNDYKHLTDVIPVSTRL